MSDPAFKEWVVDASFGCQDGAFCFIPVEGHETDNPQFVVGMNYISSKPPDGARLVGIVHPDGDEAVEQFGAKYIETLMPMYVHGRILDEQ